MLQQFLWRSSLRSFQVQAQHIQRVRRPRRSLQGSSLRNISSRPLLFIRLRSPLPYPPFHLRVRNHSPTRIELRTTTHSEKRSPQAVFTHATHSTNDAESRTAVSHPPRRLHPQQYYQRLIALFSKTSKVHGGILKRYSLPTRPYKTESKSTHGRCSTNPTSPASRKHIAHMVV